MLSLENGTASEEVRPGGGQGGGAVNSGDDGYEPVQGIVVVFLHEA